MLSLLSLPNKITHNNVFIFEFVKKVNKKKNFKLMKKKKIAMQKGCGCKLTSKVRATRELKNNALGADAVAHSDGSMTANVTHELLK